ncbi:type I restriction-modification system subunit M N-terminal domain-containing protein, partial [Rhodococcus erythropolis]|uniref:type I restriction-modification system subunit M N-terminal domain-containing protein n=1 Tax=Rhodococcus erythropolis TaxID=1833 RepID=UPI002949E9F3
MITGEVKSKVDAVWDAFWTGGISNPLEVMEQITYLLFIRRLDDEQTLALSKANMLGRTVEDISRGVGVKPRSVGEVGMRAVRRR